MAGRLKERDQKRWMGPFRMSDGVTEACHCRDSPGGKGTTNRLQCPKLHLVWCLLDTSSSETSTHTYQPGFPVGEGRGTKLYWVTLSCCSHFHHPLSLLGHCHQYSLQFVSLSLELDNVLVKRKHELGPIIYYIHKTNTYVINPIYTCLHIFIYVCTHVHAYMYLYMYLSIPTYISVWICIYLYLHTHTHICVNMYM